jgi:serine/threonine protein phosphatase 1
VVIAVGDIHGCADELRRLLGKLPITAETTVVFLGDYIDRGPSGRQVIDTVLELSERCQVVTLMGNHEDMFIDFLNDPTSAAAAGYIFNGGSATLASYSDEYGDYTIPPDHSGFLRGLRVLQETDNHLFVHGGIPDIPIDQIDPARHGHDMLWMRGSFLNSQFPWSKVIVHGHTPVNAVTIAHNRINLDTGCVFNGHLSSMTLPEGRIVSVKRQKAERKPALLRDTRSRRAAVRFRGATPVKVFRDGQVLEFETVDYSEIGFFLRALDDSAETRFATDDLISGLVGADPLSQVKFSGQVVRCTEDDNGPCYAVRIFSLREL